MDEERERRAAVVAERCVPLSWLPLTGVYELAEDAGNSGGGSGMALSVPKFMMQSGGRMWAVWVWSASSIKRKRKGE